MLDLAQFLFGQEFESEIAMRSNDKYIRRNIRDLTYNQLKDILGNLMFPMGDQKRGVIITQSFRSMFERGKFGYVTIGRNQEETKHLENQLDKTLSLI